MTTVPLFDRHHGCHCRKRRPSFFRRALRLPWRKPAVPAAHPAAGAATPPDGLPVLGDRMLSDVRSAWSAAQPSRPVNGRSLGTLPRRTPGATLPPLPVRVPGETLIANPIPVYGQAPVADVLEAERLAKVMQQ